MWSGGPRRIRTMFGGETIADSTRAELVWRSGWPPVPAYYFPRDDMRRDLTPGPTQGVSVAIKLERDAEQRVVASIKRYFTENMDEEVGDLKAKLLLDFFLGELGPTVYNGAIADAQAYFQGKVADLEGSCYEAEFSYWR